MGYLTDNFIIKNSERLQEDKLPEFIGEESKQLLIDIMKSCEKTENIEAEKIDDIHNLWKYLLSDSITYLKSKDKREYRSDSATANPARDTIAFGVDELHKYFEEYREFEALLYGADRFYRDHIMHVFRVWLIGIWILEKFKFDMTWDKPKTNLEISNDEILAIWCIVALTHDLGYPLDKIGKIKRKIEEMMKYFGSSNLSEHSFEIPTHHHFINDFILQFISSKLQKIEKDTGDDKTQDEYQTSKQSKYYLKFSKSFENFDHGIISCILLMKNLVYFLESDFDLKSPFTDVEDARQFYIRREILRAIASHSCTDIYHLYPNSLSFILILADELQISGRPTFSEIKSGILYYDTCVKIPVISKKHIKFDIVIKEKRPSGTSDNGRKYAVMLIKKWHKWLRSALDAGRREFDFVFTISVESSGGVNNYKFISKPLNLEEIYENGVKADLSKMLYS